MMNTKIMKAVNDETLYSVTGGDFGDSKYEYENKTCLYKVGDVVEVYVNSLHISTERGTIVSIGKDKCHISMWSFDLYEVPYYTVKLDKGITRCVPANAIER